ncbi:hypothetical protein ACXR2T_09870 [Leucobacter sp. HY1910]
MSTIISLLEAPSLRLTGAWIAPELSATTSGWSSLLRDDIIAEVTHQFFAAVSTDALQQNDHRAIARDLVALTNIAFAQRNSEVDQSVQGCIYPLVSLTHWQLASLLVACEGVRLLMPTRGGADNEQSAGQLCVYDHESDVREVGRAVIERLIHEYRPGISLADVEATLATLCCLAPVVKATHKETLKLSAEASWAATVANQPEAEAVCQFWCHVAHQFVWDEVPLRFVNDLYVVWFTRQFNRLSQLTKPQFRNSLAAVIAIDPCWRMDREKQVRTSNRFDKPELLIDEYELESWRNPQFRPGDSAEIYSTFDPRTQQKFTGVIMRTTECTSDCDAAVSLADSSLAFHSASPSTDASFHSSVA